MATFADFDGTASSKLPQYPHGLGSLFIRSQFCAKPQYPPKDTSLAGQTAIISGANTGIGLACASMLLGLDLGRLILAVRSQTRGDAAAKTLKQQHPHSKASIEVWMLDMESYSSIQDFAHRVKSLPRIDLVILNAGLTRDSFKLNSTTKHEEVIQINFLSTMLLAVLLLPALKSNSPASKPGRLTIINSGLSLHAKFPQHKSTRIIPAFDIEETYDANDQYCSSKFLAHLFLDKLAQYVSSEDVVINAVDPGLVKGTELHRNIQSGVIDSVLSVVKTVSGRNLEQGASTYVDAAVVKGKETHGSFIMDWRVFP